MKLSTQPYKGTRDFYPESKRLQNYIFNTMKSVVERYGYAEYTAPILEESEMYRAKSGSEMVNEQTYSFIDRGGRDVTMRPEMTPTVARMVAQKRRELNFPVRWYSIPNCFRYERPQRGRLREFWQLNVDMLGSTSLFADIEMIQMSYDIMKAFGAQSENFSIRLNNRSLMNALFSEILQLDADEAYALSKLIDRKNKISAEEFESEVRAITGNNFEICNNFLSAKSLDELPREIKDHNSVRDLVEVIDTCTALGINAVVFDPTLMRGFDYYTGIVFEVFDTNPANARSLFGGGRYDNLVDIFGVESVPAVGFGMGDVTIENYLETYGLVPHLESGIDLVLCTIDESVNAEAIRLASQLRQEGITTYVDYTDKKIGQKIKTAEKNGARYVICVGESEIAANSFTVKKLNDFSETTLPREDLKKVIVGA